MLTLMVLTNVPHRTLPPPTLTLTNTSHSLAVGWEALDHMHSPQYWLHLTVAPKSSRREFHVTKQATEGASMVEWSELPEDAVSCFQVGVTDDNATEAPVYSEKSCYYGCDCTALASEQAASGAPQSSCASCAILGALVGAAVAFVGCVLCSVLGWWQVVTSAVRGAGGKKYSLLTTNEMVATSCEVSGGDAGLELDSQYARGPQDHSSHFMQPRPQPQSQPAPLPPPPHPSQQQQSPQALAPPHPAPHPASEGQRDLASSVLEPEPNLDASQFEDQWGSCASCSRVFSATLPASRASPEEAEEALTRGGLTCIAAGALGSIHKAYFASQLRGSSEWFMLELVLFWDTSTAQVAARHVPRRPPRVV